MAAVQVGDQAPTFTAPLQDGGTFDSAALLGQKWLVLFFYPKDNTPVCTKEACAFRDSYEAFAAAGAWAGRAPPARSSTPPPRAAAARAGGGGPEGC
jgi:peroxiredoxin